MSQCFRKHGLYNIMMSIFLLLEVALKQHVASDNQIFVQVTMSLLEAKKGKCVGSTWIYGPHRTNPWSMFRACCTFCKSYCLNAKLFCFWCLAIYMHFMILAIHKMTHTSREWIHQSLCLTPHPKNPIYVKRNVVLLV